MREEDERRGRGEEGSRHGEVRKEVITTITHDQFLKSYNSVGLVFH